MNSKLVSLIAGLIGAVVSFFITREYFPNPADVLTTDSSSIVLMSDVYKQKDSLSIIINNQESIIDSLKSEIIKKPKKIVKYVPKPFPVVVTKDSIIEVTVEVPVYSIVYDTVYIDADSTVFPKIDEISYGEESYILSKKDKITIIFNRKYFKDGDVLYLFDGERIDTFVSIIYDKKALKKRIKANTSSIYALLSSKEDVGDRLSKLIKNKNKI